MLGGRYKRKARDVSHVRFRSSFGPGKIIGVGPMKASIDCELRPKKDRNHMGSLKAKRSFGLSDTEGAITRTKIGAVSHAGERIEGEQMDTCSRIERCAVVEC